MERLGKGGGPLDNRPDGGERNGEEAPIGANRPTRDARGAGLASLKRPGCHLLPVQCPVSSVQSSSRPVQHSRMFYFITVVLLCLTSRRQRCRPSCHVCRLAQCPAAARRRREISPFAVKEVVIACAIGTAIQWLCLNNQASGSTKMLPCLFGAGGGQASRCWAIPVARRPYNYARPEGPKV